MPKKPIYSILFYNDDEIRIKDLCHGNHLSVTNGAETVVKELAHHGYFPKGDMTLLSYYDTDGNLDVIRHDGKEFIGWDGYTGNLDDTGKPVIKAIKDRAKLLVPPAEKSTISYIYIAEVGYYEDESFHGEETLGAYSTKKLANQALAEYDGWFKYQRGYTPVIYSLPIDVFPEYREGEIVRDE